MKPETKCPQCKKNWTHDTRYSTRIYVRSCEPCGISIDKSEYDGIGETAKKLNPALDIMVVRDK